MEKTPEELAALKRKMYDAHEQTVKAAFEYSRALPIGNERTEAFEIHNELRQVIRGPW